MLRNRKFITCLLIGFFAVFNVFSQSDMTFALVEKYLNQANNAYDEGNLSEAYKNINGSMTIAQANDIDFEANLVMLARSIYTAYLKEIKNKYSNDKFIDVKNNLEKFPEINSNTLRKLVQQIEAQEIQKKEDKRDAQLKKQSEDNQKMLDTFTQSAQKTDEKITDFIESSKQSNEQLNESLQKMTDSQEKTTNAFMSGIGKIVVIVIIILVVIVLFIMMIIWLVHRASRQNQIQQQQYAEAFKLLAQNQSQTNQLMIGGITELYNNDSGLKLAGSSRWGQESLPEPEQTPEEKEAIRELASKCEDLGAKIDQITGRKNNSKNVSELVYKIAMKLGLPQSTSMIYFCASMVYDAGFLGIDEDLLTSENLTEEQRKSLQRHIDLAEDYIQFVPKKYWDVFINAAKYHHENMDGSGNPEGLKGDAIPEIARIIRVVDSYIALSSKRSYRGGLDKDSALEKLESQSNIYDPDVIKVLADII
ncbi:MAG: hypothetical protein MR937_02120 [Spirochaetia bacterium]|nr:hypothetical protein [Spirochaetia bacterium]